MGSQNQRPLNFDAGGMGRATWELVERQHGVIARRQLLALGHSSKGIKHRLASGRLHRLHWGVYAVGRRSVGTSGRWMAATLACGPKAVLSYSSAAALWRIGGERPSLIELSIHSPYQRRRPGLRIYRRPSLWPEDHTTHRGIPVTTPMQTLIDLALRLDRREIERAINEADKYDLVHPPELREALDRRVGEPGVAHLRRVLDRRTFRLTRDELERRFLPLAREAGLPVPETFQHVNGFEVDFWWPDLGLVVETDGLRYHRTPAEQARDRLRDQAHTAAGLANLRFTHEQVRHGPAHVLAVLRATAARIGERAAQPPSRPAIATK
jgi:very-short-patch-repair endonuclease/predicted transcriptional regulator of viral defense system